MPLFFKLKLIEEIKKHGIIWQDTRERKDPDLVENAWQKVRNVLHVYKVGLCENQWKLLIKNYRSHINGHTTMNKELSQKMDFMSSQLDKSSFESGTEAMKPRNKANTPKATKAMKRNTFSEVEYSEDHKVSVALLKLLFGSVPADVIRPVKTSLVEVVISLLPEIDTKISEHAKQQLKMGRDVSTMDWSPLGIPADICKAVWDYKVTRVVLNV